MSCFALSFLTFPDSVGPYLLLVKDVELVGVLCGHTIYRVKKVSLIRISRSDVLPGEHSADEQRYLSLLDAILHENSFFFSYTLDLSRRLQANDGFLQPKSRIASVEYSDPLFCWNGYLQQSVIEAGGRHFALPIIHGFVEITPAQCNSGSFTFALISRRSVLRPGVRYVVRGIDDQGNVANYAETEQILVRNNELFSFVQVRGSIPLFWKQVANLKYKPKPVIVESPLTQQALRTHFDTMLEHYGNVVILNLVDQKKAEGQLEAAFREAIQKLDDVHVHYDAFDFHKECKGMRYDRMTILTDRHAEQRASFGYFHFVANQSLEDQTFPSQGVTGEVRRMQEGVFRTNCIDCLDRTNVVQSLIARLTLVDQLHAWSLLSAGERSFSHFLAFEQSFRNIWADNADAMSVLYSGTGALKTDYTRTGKRSTAGALQDGVNSLTRYYLNNFKDGSRQDAYDLFVGNYRPSERKAVYATPFKMSGPRKLLIASSVLGAAGVACYNAFVPAHASALQQVAVVSAVGGAVFVGYRLIMRYGKSFVDQPSLVPHHGEDK